MLESKIYTTYKQAEKEVQDKWKAYLDSVDEDAKEIKKKLVEVTKKGNPADIVKYRSKLASLYKSRTFQNQQFHNLLQEIALQYQHSAETATAIINGKLPKVYSVNYNYMGQQIIPQIKSLTDIDIIFNLVDTQTIRNLLLDDSTLLPLLEINGKKYRRWVTSKINSEVLNGIVQGESMDKIANRLQSVTAMTAKAAIRNARTAVTSAENKGRLDSMAELEKHGAILEKQWLATSDSRTRDWHRELNGKTAEINEAFENAMGEIRYPGDPQARPSNVYNCRCTLLTNVKGFRQVEK
uniref:Minor capsid protein n=1 Tax=Siphoviridae sp. ctqzz19 TaxID=2825682 RepID=A0A8S5U276_9CAUD|nr:MAG TPA: minor capsid protein [Siphoviridae sp. ctqzz19]